VYIGDLYSPKEGYIAIIEPAQWDGMIGAIEVASHWTNCGNMEIKVNGAATVGVSKKLVQTIH
jgi:hypothetical protein